MTHRNKRAIAKSHPQPRTQGTRMRHRTAHHNMRALAEPHPQPNTGHKDDTTHDAVHKGRAHAKSRVIKNKRYTPTMPYKSQMLGGQ